MRELSYWLTVAIVAIVAVVLFKLGAASPLGAKVPGYSSLAAVI